MPRFFGISLTALFGAKHMVTVCMLIVKTCGEKYESRATHRLPSEYLLNL